MKIYFWHRITTTIIATIILLFAVGAEFIFPVLGIVFVVLFFLYIDGREQDIRVKKIKDNHPDMEESAYLWDQFNDIRYNYQKLLNGGAKNKCRTCGCGYYSNENVICSEEQIPPHYVMDIPPNDNPYAYWWYQVNGYPPPHIVRSLDDNNFDISFFIKEGKKYYSEHNNTAWDIGAAEPPEWYVNKHIHNMV